mgnify:CR=1 FL=1
MSRLPIEARVAVLERLLNEAKTESKVLQDSVFGNGAEGLKSKLARLEAKQAVQNKLMHAVLLLSGTAVIKIVVELLFT